jgi:hypothetical protein
MAYYNFKYPYALSESQPSLMGGITVPSQQTPTTPQPQQTPNPMGGSKNDKLSLMLYALGGALKGDKNFVQNTLQLQQMQEGKKKEEEKKKNYQEFLKTIDPQSPFYDLAKTMGPENLDKLLIERYKAETREIDPGKQIKQEEASVLKTLKDVGGDVGKLSKYQKLVYDNFIKRDDSESILQQLGIIGNTETGTGLIIEKISEG